jgi:hypothetical protein
MVPDLPADEGRVLLVVCQSVPWATAPEKLPRLQMLSSVVAVDEIQAAFQDGKHWYICSELAVMRYVLFTPLWRDRGQVFLEHPRQLIRPHAGVPGSGRVESGYSRLLGQVQHETEPGLGEARDGVWVETVGQDGKGEQGDQPDGFGERTVMAQIVV